MDKMCNKSGAEDLNATITNPGETENVKNRGSPVFKCFNPTKAPKLSHLDSSDYDIPSYQINQSIKSRTSSKYGSESSEPVLPFTPIFSPIPVASSVQFQPPSIHSVRTVAKNLDKPCQNTVGNSSSNHGRPQTVKSCGVFDSLGMTDKDISWVSSMATPPPKNVPGSEFNTVEKATFFPEEKFQNIQPRALFSPTLDDDSGCHPIVFTSESDDNDEEYKSNIRLSDVCATLKQLEVKSLDLLQNNSMEKIGLDKDSTISPIIKTKRKKLGSVKKKKKGSLVISPVNNDKYEFVVGENLKSFECEKIKSHSGSNFIEDDSFQSMSFSGIDELCKTLVSERSNTSVTSKTEDSDKTLISADNNVKKFYFTKATTDVYPVSSMDNLHSYAKALEENDKCNPLGNKTKQPLPQTGIVRFDILNKDSTKVDGTKRLHSDITDENDQCMDKKLKKSDEENSGWENVKQYLSESQLNVSDGEIFRTMENLEKTLASQENKDFGKSHLEGIEGSVSSQNLNVSKGDTESPGKGKIDSSDKTPKCTSTLMETSEIQIDDAKNSECHLPPVSFVAFTTASGSKISVSEKALIKAREILKECNESINSDKKTLMEHLDNPDKPTNVSGQEVKVSCSKEVLMKGFSTVSGKQIMVSAEALKKAKTFMAECEDPVDASEKLANDMPLPCKNLTEKYEGDLTSGFTTGSGKQIQISNKALEKAKNFMLELDDDNDGNGHMCDIRSAMKGFSTGSGKKIEVSAKALEKAKALMAECDNTEEDAWLKDSKLDIRKNKSFNSEHDERVKERLTTNLIRGFSDGSGNPVQAHAGNSEKGKSVKTDCEEEAKDGFSTFKGFTTGSGKTIKISTEALEKAKSLMADCEEKAKEELSTFKGFTTGSGKTIQVSTEALEKAKSLMRNCETEFTESSDNLASEWIGDMNCKGLSVTEVEIKRKTLDHKSREPECSKACISTATSTEVKVSSGGLEKAKELWSTSSNNVSNGTTEMPGSSACAQTETPVIGFLTAGGSKVTISEAALAKARERMNEWDQIKPEDSGNFDCAADSFKTPVKNNTEVTKKPAKSEENVSKISTTSGIYESDDWEEIIPSWLHVYTTSPSIASERTDLSPIISHESGKSSKPDREYIIRSPVLGSADRFHGKRKQRKLLFKDEKKPGEKMQNVPPQKNPDRKVTGKRTLALDFSVPFKKMKFLEDPPVGDVDVKTERAKAREEQERNIKEKQKVKPVMGSHLNRKRSEKQISWKEAVAGSAPDVHSDEFLRSCGVPEEVLRINVENAASCRFNGDHFFGSDCGKNAKGIPVGDGCLLILDDDNKFGVEELQRAFLASPGVQPNLVPHGWVENHLKWITWKLAHYERCFPRHFGGRCLTPNNMMLQLKYRYDREIDRNERSALKKILERDDTSIKRLVLCVCGIQKVTVGDAMGYKLELTDGWYSCPSHSDPAMTRLIEGGKIRVGTKFVTQGATLVNGEQGVSPLEINGDVYLKISTNSTRRIRWDAKLGFQKNPENFPISLGSILPQGGQISRIDVIIVRVYATLFMEKTSDGRHVTRNRRSEEKADSEYRRIQEQRMESICNEIQSEMRKSTNLDRRSARNYSNNFDQTEESTSDASTLKETADQRKLLVKSQSSQNDRFSQELREKIEKKLEKEKLIKRNVSEFLRAKIVDFRKPDFNNPAILSVWNVNEELTALLSEGKVISLMNVTISNSSRIYKPLQINTTRQTQYRQVARSVKYPARKLTQLKDVSCKVCPAFEEVDIVGVVSVIRDVSYGSRMSQVVYLTDLDANFVGIVFWGNCKDYGWENVLRTPSVVACSNLQWKKSYTPHDVPSLYVNENSVFTENPKHGYLKEEIERLKQNMPQDKTAFLTKCEEDLTTKLEDAKWGTSKNSSINDSKPSETAKSRPVNGFESKPTASSTPIKPFSVRMDSDEAEPSPIQKRIEKLQSYGEPPSLIPLLVRNNARRKLKKNS